MLASTRGRVIEAAAIDAVQHLGYVGMNPEKLQVVSGITFLMRCLHCFAYWLCSLWNRNKDFLGNRSRAGGTSLHSLGGISSTKVRIKTEAMPSHGLCYSGFICCLGAQLLIRVKAPPALPHVPYSCWVTITRVETVQVGVVVPFLQHPWCDLAHGQYMLRCAAVQIAPVLCLCHALASSKDSFESQTALVEGFAAETY